MLRKEPRMRDIPALLGKVALASLFFAVVWHLSANLLVYLMDRWGASSMGPPYKGVIPLVMLITWCCLVIMWAYWHGFRKHMIKFRANINALHKVALYIGALGLAVCIVLVSWIMIIGTIFLVGRILLFVSDCIDYAIELFRSAEIVYGVIAIIIIAQCGRKQLAWVRGKIFRWLMRHILFRKCLSRDTIKNQVK